jgi:hydrogenase-1 operon protein HyaF
MPRTIPIQVESSISLNQILPVLHEIAHAINLLLEQHQETTLDLLNLPLADVDKTELLKILGRGEIIAHLNALGDSTLWESAFPGVWIVEHRDADARLLSQLIEIAWIPSILKAHPEDIRAGLSKLMTCCHTLNSL